MKEPQITVGILSGKEIEFFLPESFVAPNGTMASGIQKAVFQKERYTGKGKHIMNYHSLPYRILILSLS